MLAQGLWVSAQEEEDPGVEEEAPVEPDWDAYIPSLYSPGDQTVTMFLGLTFPAGFFNRGTVLPMQMFPVGGTAAIMYNRFLTSNIFWGIEASLLFIGTQRKNTFIAFPLGLRGGYQFVLGRFEIPLSLTTGFAPQRYLDSEYPGFFMKPTASAFFRWNPEWSFGISTSWLWLPQWPREKEKYVDGNFIDLTLSARVHF
jgi:hypothetical protein